MTTHAEWLSIASRADEAADLMGMSEWDDAGLHACASLSAHGYSPTEIAALISSVRAPLAREPMHVRVRAFVAWNLVRRIENGDHR